MFGNSAVIGQGGSDNQNPIIGELTYNNITETSIDISVTAVDDVGVTSYKLYKDDVLFNVQFAPELVDFTIGGLSPGTSYDFYARAVDATGNISSGSNTISITTETATTNSYVTIVTASTSPTWSPIAVVNSGDTLLWSTTGSVVIDEVEEDIPVFDLSGNTGTTTVSIRSTSNFIGFTEFGLDNVDVTSIDISKATDLTGLQVKRQAGLSEIDITTLTKLEIIVVRDTGISILNTSNNPVLREIYGYRSLLTTLDLSNNPNLLEVSVYSCNLTTPVLDQMVIDLDNHGLSNGDLGITDNDGISTGVTIEYNNLVSKGWYIDIPNYAPNTPTGILLSEYDIVNIPTGIKLTEYEITVN